jgi:hypothetical protein
MKELNLHPVKDNKLKKYRYRAYIKDYDDELEGEYILIDRNWDRPTIGIIIDRFSYIEEYEKNKSKHKVVRYYQKDFKVYLINRIEKGVFNI